MPLCLSDAISALTKPRCPAILPSLAAIAQLVEQATENRRVVGSSPSCGMKDPPKTWVFAFSSPFSLILFKPIMNIPAQFLRFQRLGLQRNPFGSLTQAEEDALLVPTPDIYIWANASESLQLMGERGRGKTSLLRATLHQIVQQGQDFAYESLPEGHNRITTSLNYLDGFALDEAQRLSWWHKHRLFWQMRGRRLLITTHDDLGGWFRLYGLPYRTVQVAQFMTPPRVANILIRRIDFFALEGGPHISLSNGALAWLWDRYGDDIRSTEQALYKVFQQVDQPGPITANFLETVIHDHI